MYRLIRPLLFALDPELSHNLSLGLLASLYRIPGACTLLRAAWGRRVPNLPVRLMGLALPNPVGLAAGLDKNATCVGPLADMGFGFVELGTVTPRPQPGNPKKRLFRLVGREAIINRMGFNSAGLERFAANLRRFAHRPVTGINLGKNRDTPVAEAVGDYLAGMRAVYGLADYLAINISSPNTPNLRELQAGSALAELLSGLQEEQAALSARHGRRVPLALKIAPDLTPEQIDAIADTVARHAMDAVIATNTTLARPGLEGVALADEAGGLSGRPLAPLSTAVVRRLYASLQGRIPIIGVGGISSAADAWDKLVAGADAVQVYSSFIFRGPNVVRTIVRGLESRMHAQGCTSLSEAIAAARAA